MRRGALVVAVAGALVATPACAIQPDSEPREVPVGDRLQLDPVEPEGAGENEGSSRVFLLSDADDDGEQQLRSRLRDVPGTPEAVLDELLNGPNPTEFEAGLRTALPEDLTLISARPVAGTLNVDVSAEILELQQPALVLAVAEIVFTGSELDGIQQVSLRVDGEDYSWPDGRGELQTDPLTVFDFPGLAESTQPSYPAVPT